MRFSVWPTFERPWTEVLDLARHSEQQGWHGLWCADHYMPDTPDGAPEDGPGLECWSVLSALAAAVDRLQLGSLVSPGTFHHPAVLAKQAATADEISGGRIVLGLGAGWQVNEHRAYGVELPAPRQRVDRFEEFVQIVRGLLHDKRTTFAGEHFTITDAPCEPKGGPGPVEIMVGSASPRMLRLTARWADAWNTWGTPERIRDRSRALDAACEAEDRDPASVRRTAQALFFLRDDPDAEERILSRAPADRTLVGGPAQLVDRVAEYAAAGVDELIVPDFTFGRTAGERRASYDRFWTEVASAIA
jgi:alkanesulfonate monooxygenase SsuD/methylene tetrahydromethanopterin reductase-like flavin-dependent oxidoreductase (luciferase family)